MTAALLALLAWLVAHLSPTPAAAAPAAAVPVTSQADEPAEASGTAPAPAAAADVDDGPATDSPLCDPGEIDYAMPTPFCWHPDQLDEGH